MEAKDVITLPWKKVKNWSELPASEDYGSIYYVCETDVDIFVENIYRDISRKLNISYEELRPILVEENKAFYELKSKLFKSFIYTKHYSKLKELKRTLRVPDIEYIGNVESDASTDKVGSCVKLFEELSDVEKAIFLQKIGEISINVESTAFPVEKR